MLCKYCKENIKEFTRVCPICGEDLNFLDVIRLLCEIIVHRLKLIPAKIYVITLLIVALVGIITQLYIMANKVALYSVHNLFKDITITTKLGTYSISDDKYLLIFTTMDDEPYCFLGRYEEQANGLIEGKCLEFNSFNKYLEGRSLPVEFKWKELEKNTFNKNVKKIIDKNAKQGKFLYE